MGGGNLSLFAETPLWELGDASCWEEGTVTALLAFGTKRQLPPTDFLLRPPPPPQPTAPAALPGNQGTKSPAQGVPGGGGEEEKVAIEEGVNRLC